MRSPRSRGRVAAVAAVLALAGCGGTPAAGPETAPATSAPTTATPPPTPTPTPPSTATAAPPLAEGIDASHHQGPIDWERVARAGIRFAYLKASEGTGFTDPRFAAHRAAAVRAGVAVAGYHYFQLCSDGEAQAEHFLDVLGADPPLQPPPALDLELVGSCPDPPPRGTLLAEVRAFLTTVDERLGTTTLVYLYPDLEARYALAEDLDDHPQWARRLGDRPPARDWAVWQYDEHGAVPGVTGRVDRDRGTFQTEER
ncbi:GH25 family lysozyme [Nocardioides kongjuensis]|uniref:Lysozyme n=1 Tax=Nocardioides kongjuensis TaxID=349522 RepID=A0A852RSQ5_9ACTN|nr:lysozyme [Nocardioides kongjuensis]